MRLFYALILPEPVTDALARVMSDLRRSGVRGGFTREENLHMTLHFLGEQPEERLDVLSDILLGVNPSAFSLTLSGLGVFERSGILWAGLRPSPALERLHRQLGSSLKKQGFPVDSRRFVPHLTLVREFRAPDGFVLPELPGVTGTPELLALMESSRVSGRLEYTPLACRRLESM